MVAVAVDVPLGYRIDNRAELITVGYVTARNRRILYIEAVQRLLGSLFDKSARTGEVCLARIVGNKTFLSEKI